MATCKARLRLAESRGVYYEAVRWVWEGATHSLTSSKAQLLLKRRGDTVAYGSEFPEQTLISLSGQAGIVYCTPLGVGLFAY